MYSIRISENTSGVQYPPYCRPKVFLELRIEFRKIPSRGVVQMFKKYPDLKNTPIWDLPEVKSHF